MEGEIIVRIKDESNIEKGNNGTAINTKTGKVKTDLQSSESGEANAGILVASVLANQVYERTKQTVINEAMYQINKHFELTDDFEGKRDLNIALSVIGRTKNLATSTLAGAKLGSAGGPIGTVVGAVVGFSLGAIGEAVSIYHKFDEQDRANALRDAQLDYTRQRAGYSLTGESYK